jgi:rubrerythrin
MTAPRTLASLDERSMAAQRSRRQLIAILQLAYSGERAAAYAYDGHWRSVRDTGERARIHEIEDEEWHHRRLVGEMLAALGAAPNPWREIRATLIGRTLGLLCHVAPWFTAMYGAGRLESHNIGEYEDAARFARECGESRFVDSLLTMAEVEWDHEAYFRAKVEGHAWAKVVPLWPAPPPRTAIRDASSGWPMAAPPLGQPVD